MEERNPSVGEIVLYEPGIDDSEARGNGLAPGEKLPAIITRVWTGTCVNLRVFNDGTGVLW